MQITTMASHEKSRLMTEQPSTVKNALRSPTEIVNQMSNPPQTEYESGRQNDSVVADVMKTMKSLKNQVKGFKDENKILKCELNSKATAIDKLEKQLHKLQYDETHQK